ncbi:MAG TPA: hypothetical protein VEZ90_13375, partial [Blastocatellia bacterium]|nr:hypothetical protein [Blastocatellia bacterium]
MANKLIHLSLCLSARYGARLIRAVGTMLLALMFVGITFAKGESQPRRVPALFASVNPRSRNRRAMGCYSPKAVAASFSPESVSVSTPHGPGSP